MSHPLAYPAGWRPPLSLVESNRRIRHYAWVEARVFEALGRWVPSVPELHVKPVLAAHARHHAWHAELWEQRLDGTAELSPGGWRPGPSDDLAAFMAAVAEPMAPEVTIEKLVGVYRVLLPRAMACYRLHLAQTSEIADAATARVLRLVLADEVEDWSQGETLLQGLLATGADAERAARHQGMVEAMVVRAGYGAGPAAGRNS